MNWAVNGLSCEWSVLEGSLAHTHNVFSACEIPCLEEARSLAQNAGFQLVNVFETGFAAVPFRNSFKFVHFSFCVASGRA